MIREKMASCEQQGRFMGCVGLHARSDAYGTVCLSVRKKPIARRGIVPGHCDRAA